MTENTFSDTVLRLIDAHTEAMRNFELYGVSMILMSPDDGGGVRFTVVPPEDVVFKQVPDPKIETWTCGNCHKIWLGLNLGRCLACDGTT